MDFLLMIKALLMGVVEGVTEFLPISSTGHLIIAGDRLGFLDNEVRNVFEIFIQLGAVLAVCWEYRQKIARTLTGLVREEGPRRFAVNMLLAFLF